MRILAIIWMGFSLAYCNTEPKDCTTIPNMNLKGVGFSPLSHPNHSAHQSLLFFNEITEQPNASIVFRTPWRDSLQSSGQVPLDLLNSEQSRSQFCFTPVHILSSQTFSNSLLDHPLSATNNWTNNFTRSDYRNMVIEFARSFAPSYLFLEEDYDFYFALDPLDHANWVLFYESLYDEIKSISPFTKVGINLHHEHFMGKGILQSWNLAHPQAFQNINPNKIDIVGLTLFPFYAHVTPLAIPDNYLDAFFSLIQNKPVGILKTGWPNEASNQVWDGSSELQIFYLEKLQSILANKPIEFVNWFQLFPSDCIDCEIDPELNSISIRDAQGFPRPMWEAWLSATF